MIPDHEIGRELVAALQRTHARAEEALLEAHTLRESGFSVVQVRGLDRVIWQKEGTLYTTDAALSEGWTIKEGA